MKAPNPAGKAWLCIVLLMFTSACAREPISSKGLNESEEGGQNREVLVLPEPQSEGYRRTYHTDLVGINLDGTRRISRLSLSQWLQADLPDGRSAFVICADGGHITLVFIYPRMSSNDERIVFAPEDQHDAEAWLLRRSIYEEASGRQAQWLDFLGKSAEGRQATKGTFELNGEIRVRLDDGYVREIEVYSLSTTAPVPPDVESVNLEIDFVQKHIRQLRDEIEKGHHKVLSLLKSNEERLRELEQLRVAGTSGTPAAFGAGTIKENWRRKKPLLDFDLL